MGRGVDFPAERVRMVDRLVRSGYLKDAAVRAAFLAVPREAFVRPEDRAAAYQDVPLPIGSGQTISAPSMKKRMMLQSTFAIRARAVEFVRNGRKNRTKEPPARAMRGSQSGVPEARNAPDTATVTPRVKPRPLRWRGTVGIDVTATSGAARSFRKTNQTRPIETARHTIVMGSR